METFRYLFVTCLPVTTDGDTDNLQEDEKLKEMIYSIYNYVSAQKERDGGEDAR